MKVTAPEGVFLPALGRPVDKGETVEVSEDHGVSLIEQGWTVPAPSESKAELTEAATALGIEVPKSWTAAQIAAAIDDHTSEED